MIILFRVTAKVDMMKMFGSADSNGQMPLMITSQDDKPGLSTYKATDIVAWENSRHSETPPLVSPRNDVWETSAEIPYRWRVTSQTWVVRLISWKFVPTNQKHYPDLGGDASSVWNFCTLLSDVISVVADFSGYSNCLKLDNWSCLQTAFLFCYCESVQGLLYFLQINTLPCSMRPLRQILLMASVTRGL